MLQTLAHSPKNYDSTHNKKQSKEFTDSNSIHTCQEIYAGASPRRQNESKRERAKAARGGSRGEGEAIVSPVGRRSNKGGTGGGRGEGGAAAAARSLSSGGGRAAGGGSRAL